ncbi:unnamed protein product [Owenia fusiformis]|uniref:Uncharacterized protein n=1 Tax=Owenia fusiformis TaxID=6347 RepID=A0A8J1TWE8_OWEFU|nr:unnamed protein product [Owenia fusiformis]
METVLEKIKDSQKNASDKFQPSGLLLQPLWDLRIGYEWYLTSPIFPVILSVTFYFCVTFPWTIFDIYGQDWKWIQKFKIQPTKSVTWPLVKQAVWVTFWNHMIFILPISVAQWIWQPATDFPSEAPTVWEFFWHQYASLMIFDFEYFVWHSVHHKIRPLYRWVHSIHHQYHSPFSWVTQYLHPWELISVGVFTTTSPWIFKAHPLTWWSFMLVSIIVSVEAHIGYDFWFMPHHWFYGWGGSIKHDMHHQRPLTNFAPFYTHWDWVFGTNCPGLLAGGEKSTFLMDYDKKRREKRFEKVKAKEAFLLDEKALHHKRLD